MSGDSAGLAGRLARSFQASALTPLIALVLLLLGVLATLITPREEEPQIDVTLVNVIVPFPGASAQDVENLVATPAEQVLSRISGVDHVYSVTRPGLALISVQFEVGVKYREAVVRLHETVQANRDWLPTSLGVGEPVVKVKGIDDVPIVTLSFWTTDPARSAFDLDQVARAAEIEFKRIPGTREVTTIGGPGHVIRVAMDPRRMQARGVSVAELRAALAAANAQADAGRIVADGREISVRSGFALASARAVGELVVAVRDQGGERTPVFVGDVADVADVADEPGRYVWLGHGAGSTGVAAGEHPAVTLQITKKPGVNAADVARAVQSRVEALKGTVIPAGVEVTVTRDYGATASAKASLLIGKLAFATAAVVVLVLFALGRREALIVGVAVTLTLAATLFASWAWGFTLNRVSLFALIFSIGILVDDAIVVVENVHRWQALHPDKPLRELIPGAVDEVGGPTILATFTVIAALLPMAFVSGLMGPYMSPIPINASLGMFISLAVAFVVTPWLALRLLSRSAPHVAGGSRLDAVLGRIFGRLLRPFLAADGGARSRRLLAAGVVVAIAASVGLGFMKLVVLKMLPFDNKSEFQVVLDMPLGTPLETTAGVLRELGAEVARVAEVRDYQAYAGTASPINFNGLVRQYDLRSGAEQGDLQVNLVDKSQRQRSSHAIAGALRPALVAIGKARGGNVKVVEVPPGPPVLSPIVAEIHGPDAAGRQAVAKRVRAVLEATPDLVGVDDTVDAPARQTDLVVRQGKAALAGVAASDIVEAVRVGLAGENVTPLRNAPGKFELPVRLRLPAQQRGDLENVLQLGVRGGGGRLLSLADLVERRETVREQTVYHKDLLPVVYVVGDMVGRLDSPLYGMFDARSRLVDLPLADLPRAAGTLGETFVGQPQDADWRYSIKWDGEWRVTYETFRDMGIAYAVGLVLIYLLVVAQFKSYVVPLVIMAPIPLTIIGVMPGHALLGAQFTATSMIGMIALAGIIVRNSILLVDFIDQQLAAGVAAADAVVGAAAVRAKPIALTALAAMIGALFILDDPIFNGLAISLVFGILVSTLLTLVVIPVLYYVLIQRRPPPTQGVLA